MKIFFFFRLEFMLLLLNLIAFIISVETDASLLAVAKSIYIVCLHSISSILDASLFVAVSEVKMSRQTTLGRFGFKKSILHRKSEMETKVPDFVSTMPRTIKCNHCSKLFVNQQGLSVHEKCVHGVRNNLIRSS